MITDIAYLEMRVRNFDECRDVYCRELGMTEIQNTKSVLENGEWVSTVSAEDGNREAVIQVGNSFLVLHEDHNAFTQVLPSGDQLPHPEHVGAVGHYSFYAQSNDHAFSHMKFFLNTYRWGTTKEGPAVQPMNHAYLQRSLLEFNDPNGYVIQISEITDPRLEKQKRRSEKRKMALRNPGGIITGFDHFSMGCYDIKRAKEFYVDKLGLEIIDKNEGPTSEGYVFVAGLCDLELNELKDKTNVSKSKYQAGIVASFGFWTDNLNELVNKIGFSGDILERDVALGIPVKSITLDSGDGFFVEILEQIETGTRV